MSEKHKLEKKSFADLIGTEYLIHLLHLFIQFVLVRVSETINSKPLKRNTIKNCLILNYSQLQL